MKELNNIELEFVTKCPKILKEEISRPVRNRKKTVKEIINSEFANVASELNSYSVKNDKVLRDIHNTAYTWSKDESEEIINEVITSYCPIKMSIDDIDLIINNAIKI